MSNFQLAPKQQIYPIFTLEDSHQLGGLLQALANHRNADAFSVSAIVFNLQEEGALVAPRIVEHVGDKVVSDGGESDKVAFARRLAVLDVLTHRLVLGPAGSSVGPG